MLSSAPCFGFCSFAAKQIRRETLTEGVVIEQLVNHVTLSQFERISRKLDPMAIPAATRVRHFGPRGSVCTDPPTLRAVSIIVAHRLSCLLVSALSCRMVGLRAQSLTHSVRFTTPRQAWSGYCNALETQPLAVKAATAAVGFTLGDCIAQLSTPAPRGATWRFDTFRTLRLAVYGGAIGGPVGHHWYNFLDKVRGPDIFRASCWPGPAGPVVPLPLRGELVWLSLHLLQLCLRLTRAGEAYS